VALSAAAEKVAEKFGPAAGAVVPFVPILVAILGHRGVGGAAFRRFARRSPAPSRGPKTGLSQGGEFDGPNVLPNKTGEPVFPAPQMPSKAPLDKFKYPKAPGSKPFSPTVEPGDYVFVQDQKGVVHVLKETEGHLHPKILGNAEPVTAAGGLKVGPGGKILEIDNASGTFKFKPEILEQVKKALKDQGANVEDAVLKPFKH
jgi:hypothetical protein